MRRPRLLYAVILVVALFAAPTAWACGEMLMWLDCCAGEESEREPVAAPCHSSGDPDAPEIDAGATGLDCCAAAAGAAPLQGVSFHKEGFAAGLEPSIIRPVSAKVPDRQDMFAIDCRRLHDLGRYTLFSSLLL